MQKYVIGSDCLREWLFKVVDGPEEADKEKAATVYLIY